MKNTNGTGNNKRRQRFGIGRQGGLVLALAIVGLVGIPASAWAGGTLPKVQKPATPVRTAGHAVWPVQRVTKLGRMLGAGQKIQIPEPIVLEMIKAGLRRPWSTARKDRNQVVCRFRYGLNTHILGRAVLFCQTNSEHFQFQNTHPFMNQSGQESGPTILGPLTFQEFQVDVLHKVDPNRLRRMMAKLPPVNSRYALEVTHHGRPVSEWFMDKGQLVKVKYFKRHATPPR